MAQAAGHLSERELDRFEFQKVKAELEKISQASPVGKIISKPIDWNILMDFPFSQNLTERQKTIAKFNLLYVLLAQYKRHDQNFDLGASMSVSEAQKILEWLK